MTECPRCSSRDVHVHTRSPVMFYICGNCGYREDIAPWRRGPVDWENNLDWLNAQL